MSYKNILVTLDGSELAETALQQIPELASPETYLRVFSVVSTDFISEVAKVGQAIGPSFTFVDPAWRGTPVEVDMQAVTERQEYLKHVTAGLVERGYRISTEVVIGPVIESIVQEAARNYDLVVMATHCRTGLSRIALGSVAEAVTHHAPCPVLLIPPVVLEKTQQPVSHPQIANR
jgi:nucleotide-binding universal stress UspA family protein